MLREANSAAGPTSDLLLDGIPYDVYTPRTGSVDSIVRAVAGKGYQVQGGGVVVDLSMSPLTKEQLGNIQLRVQLLTSRVSDVIVMEGGG